jgi:site-specific recombinase XerD
LLYNSGARVQELADLRVAALRLFTPPLVTLTGKGNKTRHVPLWAETVSLLQAHLTERGIIDSPQSYLFVNAHGQPLSRFGIRYLIRTRVAAARQSCASLSGKRISPHSFRHATAMHLLQSGVDLDVIKNWLGHVNLQTTHGYVEIDLEMKRKALSACAPVGNPDKLRHIVDRHKDVISWLNSL